MAKRKKKAATDKKKRILGVLLFILALLILVSLISHQEIDDARVKGSVDSHLNPFEMQWRNQGGMMGAYLSCYFLVLLGWLSYFVPLGLILSALRLFSSELTARLRPNGILLFVISIIGTMIYNVHLLVDRTLGYETGTVGGYAGEKLTLLFIRLVGETGSYLILSGVVLVLMMTYTSITPWVSTRISLPGGETVKKLYGGLRDGLKKAFSFNWLPSFSFDKGNGDSSEDGRFEEVLAEEITVDSQEEYPLEEPAEAEQPGEESSTAARPKAARPVNVKSIKYEYPAMDILEDNSEEGPSVTADELNFTARMLRDTLETFGVKIEGDIEKFPGPVITRYEFKPAAGIKVNQIINLSDDLALALKAKRIRIIAPIPGKAAVGVEIPNRAAQGVRIKEILKSKAFQDSSIKLPLALGMTTAGKPYVADLAKMPHLLIAGATGAGKSVCMNVLITSLIYRLHPLHVRFILIDPKMLEMSVYAGIPHLGRPVVTRPKQAERVLADAVTEMENRYRNLANAGVRNIDDFNKKQTEEEKKLPYIIILVDELADLMMSQTSTRTEMLITRLAQMARAVGIHLVLATQRPSVDVITGLIKANFPARIAFQVSSKVDSRTIIDANGAEKLLGNGDMLYLASGQPESRRLHGAFISNEETNALVEFINNQGLEMLALQTISQSTGDSPEKEVDLGDPLFKEACEVCLRHKQGSVSLLQRRLGIGYQRAARLIDKLEQAGIVSKFDGSKAREVIVDRSYVETLFGGPSTVISAKPDTN